MSCRAVLAGEPLCGMTCSTGRILGQAHRHTKRRLWECRQSLVSDIVQSCGLERATGAVDAGLQCIIQMAASPALQV